MVKKWRGRVSSYVSIGGQIGVILAALLSAIILPTLGWRPLFFIGILPVILAFYLRRNLAESPEWLEAQKNKRNNKLEATKSNPLLQLINTPKMAFTTIAITIMATVQVAGYNGLMVWLPSMLQQSHGFSVSGSAIWTISTIIGMIVGMLTFGIFMDRFGTKITYGLFLISSGIAVFLYSFASSSITLLIGGAIVGFLQMECMQDMGL